MDVHCNDDVTDDELAEVETWINTSSSSDIETIVVGEHVVAVHGQDNGVGLTGTARRKGALSEELEQAAQAMRRS